MALQTKLVQKLSQQLLMTPQLQQAIKLLQMGRPEFLEALEKELLENPVLEVASEDDSTEAKSDGSEPLSSEITIADPEVSSESGNITDSNEQISKGSEQATVEWADYLENFTDYKGVSSPKGTASGDERPNLENSLTRSEKLSDYVLSQVRMMDFSQKEEEIALYVVGNLDKDGYLCVDDQEIAQICKCTIAEVESVLCRMRELDPPGIAARNLGECLFIQLEHMGLGEGLAAKIVLNHLDKLEKKAYEKIAKMEHVAIEEVYGAVKAIQNLEPRPARPFGDDTTRYIVPDIYVYKINDEYVISLNEEGMPRLRVSPYYLDLLKEKANDGDPSHAYLADRLKAATWLIKSIHQRQKTIYRVTESIVKRQKEFFDKGINSLKPMVLKDVADDIGMHESTVSRVTTNKYVHTSHGVFELKFFFTSGIKGSDGDVSSSSVKEKIKALIATEDQSNPISDQAIVEALKKDNIEIARRTVAKYRESLGILSSSKRKKVF